MKVTFTGGIAWILADSQELAVGRLDDGELTVLLFTSQDLADSYARQDNLAGKTPRMVMGTSAILQLLQDMKTRGVTHVSINHSPGQQAPSAAIDKVINDVSQQTGTQP